MSSFDWVLIVALLVLCIPTRTRLTALVLVFDYIVYFLFIEKLDGLMYYGLTATLNFTVALVLMGKERRNRIIMYLAVMQVPINFIGWAMYENYHQPHAYNSMALTVSALQVLALIIGLINARLVNVDTGLRVVLGFVLCHKKDDSRERAEKVEA